MSFGFLLFLLCALVTFFPGLQKPILARECEPNDQDRYIYRPWRLQVLSECVRVTGIVHGVYFPGSDDDGDATVQLTVDPGFEKYVNDANLKYQEGDLHVEVICYARPGLENIFALLACGLNSHSYRDKFPSVGQHIWMEGKWVLDNGHEGWAELHPLYRWGISDQ